MPDRPPFGEVLRRFRLDANLSQDVLAERASISKQTVGALERGYRRAPFAHTLELLVAALHLDPQQRRIFEDAARASAARRVRHDAPAFAQLPPAMPELPAVPTSFVGREADSARIAELLESGRCVTIWGSGGIRKTRLTLETASLVAPRFADGLWFVDLAQVSESAGIATAIASAMRIQEVPKRSIFDTIAASLAGKNALLILDNAEHLIEGCATAVDRLIRDVPALAIVCTSREPLRVSAERVYRLNPLPMPIAANGDLERAPAIRLFLDRAESTGVSVNATRDLPLIAMICERLDAIPLAIELAAAQMPLMQPMQLLHGLTDCIRLLAKGSRSADPRHQSLHAMLDWSYAGLSEAERVVFRRLSVWPHGWTFDDAVAVAGEEGDRWTIIHAVATLVDRSLVVAGNGDGSERFYHLLQTTRAFAIDLLNESGETARCERLQAERVRDHVDVANDAWDRGDEEPFRNLDVAAVRAALRWTITLESDVPLGAHIAAAARLWEFHGLHVEGLRWIDEARLKLGPQAEDLCSVSIGRAILMRRLMMIRQSYESAHDALVTADQRGGERQYAEAALLAGSAAALLGDEEESFRLLTEAARIFERLGHRRGQLRAEGELVSIAARKHRYAEARDRLSALVALCSSTARRASQRSFRSTLPRPNSVLATRVMHSPEGMKR
jgi:predicted ATPase/DNA-binding XRE family transcriptional regulator